MELDKKSNLNVSKQALQNNKPKALGNIKARREIKMLKTYIIQFIFKNGNGWAFVNATSPKEAETVFNQQTKFKGAIVTGVKETKWFGNTMQLVFEGSVCTTANVDVSVSLSDLIENSDAYDSVADYLNSVYNLSDYYTKEEANKAINAAIIEALSHLDIPLNLDLSDYVKKTEVTRLIQSEIENLNIHDGQDGITPHIAERTYHWIIGDVDTGVVAKGKDGTNGRNGTDGTDGVGIESINYERSYVSGGANKLIIKLTNSNTPFEYIILNGKDGSGVVTPSPNITGVEVLSLYRGDIAAAKSRANSNPTTMFQFILDTTDSKGNPFTKIIWYTGDDKFIDALGTVMFTR